jgi:serine/threonine-protein kinase
MTYRFVQRLAGGAFSEVFTVEDLASALPERLVLKRLTPEMSARPEVREAFAAEAVLLRELRHPNVVTFRRCYFDEAGRVCLLMEEVAGERLDAWARRHAAEPARVLDVFADVLRAVDYLHHRAQPYLHLDLKPDNIVVAAAGGAAKPVLIDFGIARRSGRPGLKAYTPPYAAPEQQSGGRLDPATDVHALGQVLAELLAGLALPPETAEALGRVAERARDPSRSARFADAGQMGLAFRQARRAEPAPAPPRRLATTLPGRLRPAVAAAAGAAAVLALALTFLALRGERPAPAPGGERAPGAEPAPPTAGEADRLDRLLREAGRAADARQLEAATRTFQEAQRLAATLAQDGENARATARALEELRRRIDLARQGVAAGDRALLGREEGR